MKAVVLRAPGDVGVEEVADPSILDPGDAIVAVRATAICGADLFPFHGMTPGFEAGTVLGHEFAGEVVEVGADVRHAAARATGRQREHDLGRHLPLLPRRPRDAVRQAGRCSATRASTRGSTAARPSSSACRRPTARCARCRTRSRDEAAVFLADILPTGLRRGRPRRGRGGRHGRRRRLRAGRADGGAVRRGRGRHADRGRRRVPSGARSPRRSVRRRSSRRGPPTRSPRRPAGSGPTS